MSWDELLSIVRVARAEQREARATPPAACPNDGEPLKTAPGGALRCPADGWQWDGRPL